MLLRRNNLHDGGRMKHTLLLFVILALAVYRATVLLLHDYITTGIRNWMQTKGRHFEYLSTCPWCSSMWVAAVLVPLTLFVSWWYVVDTVLACSAVAAVVSEKVN